MESKKVIENGKEYEVIFYSYGTIVWHLNDKRHREDAPAVEWANGSKDWYLNGISYTESDHKAEVEKRNADIKINGFGKAINDFVDNERLEHFASYLYNKDLLKFCDIETEIKNYTDLLAKEYHNQSNST